MAFVLQFVLHALRAVECAKQHDANVIPYFNENYVDSLGYEFALQNGLLCVL